MSNASPPGGAPTAAADSKGLHMFAGKPAATATATAAASATAAAADASSGVTESSLFSFETLKMCWSQAKGHHFVAKADIAPGTLLLTDTPLCSSPFVSSGADRSVPPYAIDELTHKMLQNPERFMHLCFHKYAVSVPKLYAGQYTQSEWAVAYSRVRANCFAQPYGEPGTLSYNTLTGEAVQRTVAVLFPALSVFNHSCAPNAVIIYGSDALTAPPGSANAAKGATASASTATAATPASASAASGSASGDSATPWFLHARVFAVSAIKAGAEVCICYRSELLTLPVQRRKTLIYQAWRFNCACARCAATTNPNLLPTSAYKNDALLNKAIDLSADAVQPMMTLYDQIVLAYARSQAAAKEANAEPVAFADAPPLTPADAKSATASASTASASASASGSGSGADRSANSAVGGGGLSIDWVRQCERFYRDFKLHIAHWRRIRIRSHLLTMYQDLAQYEYTREVEALNAAKASVASAATATAASSTVAAAPSAASSASAQEDADMAQALAESAAIAASLEAAKPKAAGAGAAPAMALPAPTATAAPAASGSSASSSDVKHPGASASASSSSSASAAVGPSYAKPSYGLSADGQLCALPAHTYRYKMLHLLRDAVQCNALLLPALHNAKLHTFRLYAMIGSYCGLTERECDAHLRHWDPAFDAVRTHFAPYMDA